MAGIGYTFFFYGTLMDPQVLSWVTGVPFDPIRLRPAVLSGFRRVYVADVSYPAIYADPESDVTGCLVRGISAAAANRIDQFENDGYDRQNLRVRTANGGDVPAAVYVAGKRMALTDQDWDFQNWRRRHKRRYLERLKYWVRQTGYIYLYWNGCQVLIFFLVDALVL